MVFSIFSFTEKDLESFSLNSFMAKVPIVLESVQGWFLYDRDLRHERVKQWMPIIFILHGIKWDIWKHLSSIRIKTRRDFQENVTTNKCEFYWKLIQAWKFSDDFCISSNYFEMYPWNNLLLCYCTNWDSLNSTQCIANSLYETFLNIFREFAVDQNKHKT